MPLLRADVSVRKCNVGPREAQLHGAVRDWDAHEHCFVTIIDQRDLSFDACRRHTAAACRAAGQPDPASLQLVARVGRWGIVGGLVAVAVHAPLASPHRDPVPERGQRRGGAWVGGVVHARGLVGF